MTGHYIKGILQARSLILMPFCQNRVIPVVEQHPAIFNLLNCKPHPLEHFLIIIERVESVIGKNAQDDIGNIPIHVLDDPGNWPA